MVHLLVKASAPVLVVQLAPVLVALCLECIGSTNHWILDKNFPFRSKSPQSNLFHRIGPTGSGKGLVLELVPELALKLVTGKVKAIVSH